MSDSMNKGSSSNDALSQDADRVIPRHTVNGKNAATGESSTMINDLEAETGKPHSGKPDQAAGFNPNDAQGGGDGGADGTQYTSTRPAEVASASHTLPGPNSIGAGQKSKGHNPTQ